MEGKGITKHQTKLFTWSCVIEKAAMLHSFGIKMRRKLKLFDVGSRYTKKVLRE